MKCIVCQTQRKYITETRPCCNKCEKTAPTCVSAPGLFTSGIAGMVARATKNAVRQQKSTNSAMVREWS